MSKRDWKILFEDIIESIDKINEYTNNLSFEDFSKTPLVVDAVVRNIEIIGEASKNIDQKIQNKFNDIPWSKIKGIRNRIVHEYFAVDVSIIWYIIQNELEPLKIALTNYVNRKNQLILKKSHFDRLSVTKKSTCTRLINYSYKLIVISTKILLGEKSQDKNRDVEINLN